MAAEHPHETKRLLDARAVSWLLRSGLVGSALLLAIGLVLQLASGETVSRPMSLGAEAEGEARSAGEVVMGLGVVVLALTPVARVLALVGLWVRERDWRFVMVAGVVLVVLGVAVMVGG